MPAYLHQGRVAFHETDAAGIVHFSSYFLYAEEAETAALSSLGIFSDDTLRHYLFPRVQANAQYSHPLRFPEAYTVHTSLTRVGNSSLTWQFDVRSEGGGLARVELITVRLRASDGAITPYTEQEKAALRRLMPAVPDDKK